MKNFDNAKRCPRCGCIVDGDSKFCPSCGWSLVESHTIRCPRCGKEIISTASFCTECGTNFGQLNMDPSLTNTHMLQGQGNMGSPLANPHIPQNLDTGVPNTRMPHPGPSNQQNGAVISASCDRGLVTFTCPVCGKKHKFDRKQDGIYCQKCDTLYYVDTEGRSDLEDSDGIALKSIKPEMKMKSVQKDLTDGNVDCYVIVANDILFVSTKVSSNPIIRWFAKFGGSTKNNMMIRIVDIEGYSSTPNPNFAKLISDFFDFPCLDKIADFIACRLNLRAIHISQGSRNLTFFHGFGSKTKEIMSLIERRRQELYGGNAPQLAACDDFCMSMISACR